RITLPDPQDESTSSESVAPEPQATSAAVAVEEAPAEEEEEEQEQETQVTFDDLDGQSLSDAIDATIVAFDDGDIVKGRVVKIDSDEVLLDIGYKSEGV